MQNPIRYVDKYCKMFALRSEKVLLAFLCNLSGPTDQQHKPLSHMCACVCVCVFYKEMKSFRASQSSNKMKNKRAKNGKKNEEQTNEKSKKKMVKKKRKRKHKIK